MYNIIDSYAIRDGRLRMEWWTDMRIISQVFFVIAVAGTVGLLTQVILSFFGIGDADADGGDDGFDIEGLHLFTIRGIIAFFTMGGWTGVVLTTLNFPDWLSIIVSVLVGTLALFCVALIFKLLLKTESNGIMSLDNAVGKVATVYLRIPKKNQGHGKINVTVNDKYCELDAISFDDIEHGVGENVKVVGVLGDNLIVDTMDSEIDVAGKKGAL